MIENPLCVLWSVKLFNKEVFEIGLLGLNFNGDRITLGEENSFVLLNVDDGKVTVLTEGNDVWSTMKELGLFFFH